MHSPIVLNVCACCQIDASIDKVSKEIEELKTKVRVEKTVRAYKEEYESIARVINELPSRQEIAAYVVDALNRSCLFY